MVGKSNSSFLSLSQLSISWHVYSNVVNIQVPPLHWWPAFYKGDGCGLLQPNSSVELCAHSCRINEKRLYEIMKMKAKMLPYKYYTKVLLEDT